MGTAGPCRYTSARLLTEGKFAVAHGRIEARIRVPAGIGLWPAFWMLGTDFAVEWRQGEIVWFVDGQHYHEARPSDIAPNSWAFDHEFYLLLNLAVGGQFGGPVAQDTAFPATMLVDHVRVYRASTAP